MPTFSYIAVNAKNESVNGTIEQESRSNAIDTLAKQGLRPISIKETTAKPSLNNIFGTSKHGRVKSDQLVLMTRQLSAMVGAGVPLVRSLDSLAAHSENPALKATLEEVTKDIEAGASLADALAKHPDAFNDVYINMVRAGEAAGILDDILKRLAVQLEKSASVRKKIKGAMIYPIVLLGITVFAFFGLMLFIVPQIGEILTSLGGEDAKLPGITLFMLAISNFLVNYWFIVFPILFVAVVALIRVIKTPKGKQVFHQTLLKIPVIKSLIRKLAVARFARTFSALIGAGVAVLEAIHVTARSVGNLVYEAALVNAADEVKNGKPLSTVIDEDPLFPSILTQMLAVGEETGQTDSVLIKVAEFYEEEVDVAVDSLSAIIEPVMIVIMGSLVGLVAVSVMLPITSLAGSIQ